MHRSLQIPEIVKLICEQLEVINPQTSEQFKCLAAFLRTCRAFHEPALSIVWSKVDNLVPLLKCMPRDLWMIEKRTFKFNREIRPTDWPRFMRHAVLVRTFGYGGRFDFPALDISVYQSLHLAAGGWTLLPNLRALSWPGSNGYSSEISFISLFMNPNLSQVRIIPWFDVTPADLSLVANLPSWCPSATDVTISILHRNAATVTSAAVLRWHTLSHLDVGSISKDAFLHVGTLPNLQYLRLSPHRDPDSPVELPVSYPSPLFPALREIEIRSQHLSFCTQFLKLLSPRTPLFHITFGSLESSPAGWTDLVNTITVACCPSSLRSLEIKDYDELYSDSDVGPASKHLAVYGDTLKPLLTFSGVTHAQLAASHGFDFDDHFLEELAVAWPRLQSLRVDTERKPDGLPRATLACLVSFARHCHHIECLQLTVNARDIPASNPTGRIASNTLLTLGVGFSPISSPVKVAAFLSGVLPKLKRIIYYAANYGDESEEPDTSRLEWSEVGAALLVMIHVVNFRYFASIW